MQRSILLGAMALVVAVGLASAAGPKQNAHHHLLSFQSMYGVDGILLGPQNPVGGEPGDELPWIIGSGKGTLDTDGRLKMEVHDLVFAFDPLVPPELQGKNDETEFRVAVSCQTVTDGGQLQSVLITSDGFPTDVNGDCNIDAKLDLPSPCLAPMVFVIAGSEDKWFAVNGFESGED